MTHATFDWTTRITATLALALAAGCTPALDADPAGTFVAHHEEAGDGEKGDFKGEAPEIVEDVPVTEPEFEEVRGNEPPAEEPAPIVNVEDCTAVAEDGGAGIAACVASVAQRGGTVTLEAGEFVVTETIHVPSGVEIVGAGRTTVLTLDAMVDAPVVAVGSLAEEPSDRVRNVSLRDFAIYGAKGDQSMDSMEEAAWVPVAGIVVRAAEDVQISSIIVTDTVSSGVMVDAGSERVSLSEVAVFDADFDGVTVQASARVRIEKSTLSGNGGAGVSFDWGVVDAEVLSTTITSNGRTWGGGDNPGVYMAMTSNSSLTGNTISRNDGNGVVLTNQGMAEVPSQTCASDNVFRGNTLEGNGQFAFWLTHATCTGNRSIDNATLRNAWGPIFEPVCGQMETVAATCEGAGCATTCGG